MTHPQQQQLRNRKHVISTSHQQKHPETNGLSPTQGPIKEAEENCHDDNNDSYQWTPLIERSHITRLDVGPFVLLYIGLILMDVTMDDSLFLMWGVSLSTLAWIGALLGHLGLVLWGQWSVPMRATIGYYKSPYNVNSMQAWTHCLIVSTNRNIENVAGIVPVHRTDVADSNVPSVVVISFKDCVFRCSAVQPDIDVTLWNPSQVQQSLVKTVPAAIIRFRPVQYPTHLPIQFYASWRGHTDLVSSVTAGKVYGLNTTALLLPSLMQLLAEQLVAPFFIFQVFCVILWSLDEYWYYALFTLLALLMFESTVAYNRLKGLQRLHEISHKYKYQRVWVRRGLPSTEQTAWMSIPVHELLPGDWVGLSGNHVAVPADIMLLQGTAVCDEALLTGESVPQLKQPLDTTSTTACLDLQSGEHKESILFGGTTLVVGTPPNNTNYSSRHHDQYDNPPPDQGITGIVLRTGFETAQGSLLRTMAHSSKSADGVHTLDTFMFILLLLVCAVGAAAFVLHEGWYDERRNRFRLLLHVVIIITSVVPPELPMELSLAVTNSVQSLILRCQVYCTEHFRIPWAGQVNVCCFDKTGTLTSDEMRLKGVRLFPVDLTASSTNEEETLVHPLEADIPWSTKRIMAACHSLALTASGEGKSRRTQIIGDPMEQATMKDTGYRLVENDIVAPSEDAGGARIEKNIRILHRFAFSSKLKRMTVLVTEEDRDNGIVWALVKGAPETIKPFLSPNSTPSSYDEAAYYHMSRGRRVLAMAFREVGNVRDIQKLKDGGRDSIEQSNLTFAGFLVLECPLKPDSRSVISELKKSGHNVVMITGDAILTAAEVARQVGIIRRSSASHNRPVYIIQKRENKPERLGDDPFSYFVCSPLARNDTESPTLSLSRNNVQSLLEMSKQGEAAFCISGDVLVELATLALRLESSTTYNSRLDEKHLLLSPESQSILKVVAPLISVFARHAPYQKEAVVAAFNHAGFQTLMCGDGTNDVGALKRAHVGISIISAPGVESKQKEAAQMIADARSENKREGKTRKTSSKKSKASLEVSLRKLREAKEELDQVELGDASVAAPFTSRAVSIKCCKDVIQQGRCTLVTMLQIYKILGINCLINALVLSKLFLHGVKQGDRQLTILGIVVAALFFFVSRAEPLPTLSVIRPPSSVLCTQALVSITSQFCLHFTTILLATEAALSFVDPFDPSMVPDGPFNPNVLNSCTFLLTCLSTVNTFAVNYRGRPFMKDLNENKLFYRSLQACYAVLAICALEIFPPLNDLLQLTALPSTSQITVESTNPLLPLILAQYFPIFFVSLMALDTVLCFAFERVILKAFEGH